MQVPDPQAVRVQVDEGVPALLNLYLVLEVSGGTVKVTVQAGSTASVVCAPLPEMDPGTTLQPDNDIVPAMLVPAVVMVTGCAICADTLCSESTIITQWVALEPLTSKVTVALERVELTVSYSADETSPLPEP
jgi:hypothetical protein